MGSAGVTEDGDRYRLGVLLVHGIGEQPQRETLVRWGDALVQVLADATGESVEISVGPASVADGQSGSPAAVTVAFRSDDTPEERWLLAEGWWADAFPAPTYREIVSWSLRALPWTVALHVAGRYWRRRTAGGTWSKVYSTIRSVAELLFALALVPLFLAVLLVAMVVGALPIPRLRSFLLAVQSKLSATVGDSLAFVESPVRTGLIQGRIQACHKWLQERCDKTVVVAHSQGAAVVLDVLGGFDDQPGARDRPLPDRLVTFGAGINKLASLSSRAWISLSVGRDPAASALGAMLGAGAALIWLFFTGELRTVGLAALLLVASVAVLAVILAGLRWLVRRPDDGAPRPDGTSTGPRQPATRVEDDEPGQTKDTWRTRFLVIGMTVSSLAVVGVLIYLEERYGIPLGQLALLAIALFALTPALWMILGDEMRILTTESVGIPSGLARWLDLYASCDPVSNGPTRVGDRRDPEDAEDRFETLPVWNQGSFLSDHTTYWRNRDEFVLRVAHECAAEAGSRWAAALPAPPEHRRGRPRFRVGLLRRARAVSALGWLAVLWLGWGRYGESVPIPFELPAWLTWTAPIRFTLLAAAVLLAAALTATLLRLTWRPWVTAEQTRLLAGRDPASGPRFALTLALMGTLLTLSPLAVIVALRQESLALPPPAEWGDPLWMILGIGVSVAGVLGLWSWLSEAVARSVSDEDAEPETSDP